jgi:transglycosylase-like protein
VVIAVSLGLPQLLAARPAGADEASNLQSEATQLNQELIQEQLQVDGFEHQYEADTTRVQQDAAAIAAVQLSVSRDQAKVRSDRARLSAEAVASYLNAGSVGLNQTLQLFSGGREAASNRTEYENVAIGNTAETLALLHTDQVQLLANQATLDVRTRQDQSAQSAAATATANAQQVADQLAAKQALVKGQLAVAINDDRAEQAATAVSSRTAVGGAVTDPGLPPFLQCVIREESGGNYQAVSPNGLYMGAFQFSQGTWNEAAQLAGLPGLVGVRPNDASDADQDTLAIALYDADGERPWYDPCRS